MFEVNSDGTGSFWTDQAEIIAATKDRSDPLAPVYPTVGAGVYHFESLSAKNSALSVIDVQGKVIRSWSGKITNMTIDLQAEKRGIYSVKVAQAEGQTAIFRVIKY